MPLSPHDRRLFAMYSTILLLIFHCTCVAEAFTLTRNVNLVDADQDATLGATAQQVTGHVEVAQVKPVVEAENATISIKYVDDNRDSTNNFTSNSSSTDNKNVSDGAVVVPATETGTIEKNGENTTDLHILQSSKENRSTVVDSDATSYSSLSVATTGSDVNLNSSKMDLQSTINTENTPVKDNNINATINYSNEVDHLKQSPANSNNEETSTKSMYLDQINFSDVVATRKYKTIDRKKSSQATTVAPATILTTESSILTTTYSSNITEQNKGIDKINDLNDSLIYNITKNTTIENELKYEFQKEAETKNNLLAVNIGNAAESQIKLVEQSIMDNQVVVKQEIDQHNVEVRDKQNTKVEEKSEDDTLSVQPIAGYKNKNSSIYAVKSTYKKPKKLEITQPKSYLRDPNDNSWRNQSINSLGIVFKANNVSKQFTLVSKNKSETESNQTVQKHENNLPELKERLGKLSEMRKSKKKKPNEEKVGEYEDVAYPYVASVLAVPVQDVVIQEHGDHDVVSDLPPTSLVILKENYKDKPSISTQEVDKKPVVNFFDDFEALVNEEMQSMELNKSSTTTTTSNPVTSPRKPTVQHFPSRETTKPSYDMNFYNKINEYTPELEIDNFPIILPPIKSNPNYVPAPQPVANKDYYSTEPPYTAYSIVNNEGSFNRDSFVVKHFRDFVGKNQRVSYEKNSEGTAASPASEYLDKYSDTRRVATAYPVLYNNSVVHKTAEGNKVIAASTAYMKRIYGSESPIPNGFAPAAAAPKPCEPDCDKITVELSPDYELHYYVPEQEEIREIERSPPTVVYHDLNNVHEMRFYNRDGL